MQIAPRISQRTLLLIAVPLVFQLLFVHILLDLLSQSEIETTNEQHAKDVIYEADALNSRFTDAGFAMGGYSITKNKLFLHLYDEIAATIPARFKKLGELIGDNPPQQKMLRELEDEWQSMGETLKVAKHAVDASTVDDRSIDEKQLYAELKAGRAKLNRTTEELVSANQDIKQKMPGLERRSRDKFVIYLICGVVLSAALTVLLAHLFSLELKRKLRLLTDNTMRLASGKELVAPIGGKDGFALLDNTFHSMAKQLAEAERKEKEILNNASDVICSIDPKGRISRINPACLHHWGYAPEELIGMNFFVLILPEDQDGMRTAFNSGKSEGAPSSIEGRLLTKTQEIKYFLWSLNWSTSEPACSCVAHDITEKKRLEKMKEDFVEMVSHDLRSPLTSTQLMLKLLTQGAFGQISQEAVIEVEKTAASITRLISMINDLLDVERLESGRLELDLRTQATRELIDKAVDAVRPLAEQKRLTVELPAVQYPVVADEERLIQVLINLLSNAIKFSPEGAVISISTIRGQSWVEFAVSDMGRGIAPENQQAIFERFKQVDKSDAQLKKGFGLGLPICKMIIEEHGGTIGLESRENEGSRFWFRVPDKC